MVTAIALILGFSIGFLADWITDVDFEISGLSDIVLLFGIVLASILEIISLFRILKYNYPIDRAKEYYNSTLRLLGVSMAVLLASILISALI